MVKVNVLFYSVFYFQCSHPVGLRGRCGFVSHLRGWSEMVHTVFSGISSSSSSSLSLVSDTFSSSSGYLQFAVQDVAQYLIPSVAFSVQPSKAVSILRCHFTACYCRIIWASFLRVLPSLNHRNDKQIVLRISKGPNQCKAGSK